MVDVRINKKLAFLLDSEEGRSIQATFQNNILKQVIKMTVDGKEYIT